MKLPCIFCIQNTQKHDRSPSSGWILTIPMWQSLILSMIDRRNARGGQRCHHRRRTGTGRLRRWRCKFFGVADVGGSRESHSVYEWANRHVGWWLWVLARVCQRFGVNWLCDGWAVKMYCFGRHGCDVCFVSRWKKMKLQLSNFVQVPWNK